jgi:cobalamin biosynthesis protein CobT
MTFSPEQVGALYNKMDQDSLSFKDLGTIVKQLGSPSPKSKANAIKCINIICSQLSTKEGKQQKHMAKHARSVGGAMDLVSKHHCTEEEEEEEKSEQEEEEEEKGRGEEEAEEEEKGRGEEEVEEEKGRGEEEAEEEEKGEEVMDIEEVEERKEQAVEDNEAVSARCEEKGKERATEEEIHLQVQSDLQQQAQELINLPDKELGMLTSKYLNYFSQQLKSP